MLLVESHVTQDVMNYEHEMQVLLRRKVLTSQAEQVMALPISSTAVQRAQLITRSEQRLQNCPLVFL